jgi:hypothetical protein
MPAFKPTDSFKLQERDVHILRGFFESRVMRAEHASALFFEGRDESAKKGLQRLKRAGLIAERPRKPWEPAVLYLASRALVILEERGILLEYPRFSLPALERRAKVSDRTLAHELAVMDAKAALCRVIAQVPNLSVAEFTTWPLLNQFEVLRQLQEPDGFIRIREQNEDGVFEHCFFVEIDRSTEVQEILGARASCYRHYNQSGLFAERMGGSREKPEEYPFRVLFILKTEERRNNTAETLLRLNPPIFTQVWLATLDDVMCDPLGTIWVRPVDYRDATADTAFSPERRDTQRAYLRNAARETFVRQNVKLSNLLS